MITENIILDKDLKKSLKHLSIDTGSHVSTMLIACAEYILEKDLEVPKMLLESSEPFTMKIDENLKAKIKEFCSREGIRIKDFWNEAATIAVEQGGCVRVERN